jgi:hypothetical protein
MRGGRARWKIETETFNTLKHQGDNCEHHYGPGAQQLSVVFATLMRLAFLVDQTQQLCCALVQAVGAKLGRKRLLWERMRALFSPYRRNAMRELCEALFYGFVQSRPIFIIDTSSSLSISCRGGWGSRRSPIGTAVVYPDDERYCLSTSHRVCLAHDLTCLRPKGMRKPLIE